MFKDASYNKLPVSFSDTLHIVEESIQGDDIVEHNYDGGVDASISVIRGCSTIYSMHLIRASTNSDLYYIVSVDSSICAFNNESLYDEEYKVAVKIVEDEDAAIENGASNYPEFWGNDFSEPVDITELEGSEKSEKMGEISLLEMEARHAYDAIRDLEYKDTAVYDYTYNGERYRETYTRSGDSITLEKVNITLMEYAVYQL